MTNVLTTIPAMRGPDRFALMPFGPAGNLYIFDHEKCTFLNDEDGTMLIRTKDNYNEMASHTRSLNITDREEKRLAKEKKAAEERKRLAGQV